MTLRRAVLWEGGGRQLCLAWLSPDLTSVRGDNSHLHFHPVTHNDSHLVDGIALDAPLKIENCNLILKRCN